ncbi:MAG: IclR family transcriptional regulator [Gemmatimonas sp.]
MAAPQRIRTDRERVDSDVRYKGEAVARAARVLALFTRGAPEHSLAQLVERTGVPKATLLGILNTLVVHDLLMRDSPTGPYRLGFAWLRLGDVRRNLLDIRESAVPLMRQVRDAVDETVILSLKVGDRRVHLDYVESLQPIRRVTQLGHEGPLHVGAAGLALLAGMPPTEIEAYLARRTDVAEPRAELLQTLNAVKRDGYAVVAGTVNPHTAAVSAPVKSYTGETVAALTISCPNERFTKELRRRCIKAATDGAAVLSRALGYTP